MLSVLHLFQMHVMIYFITYNAVDKYAFLKQILG